MINHIAWCRFVTAHEKPTRVVLCDSDADGAFAVYRLPAATAHESAAMIEECARHLEAVAKDFIAIGNDAPEDQRDGPYGMADSYGMAANEVRRMDPQHRAKEARNLTKTKAWVKTIGTPAFDGFPNLEPSRKVDN